MSLICSLIGHSNTFKSTFLPSFDAEIITEYKFETTCKRCGKYNTTHQKWDEEKRDFIDVVHD